MRNSIQNSALFVVALAVAPACASSSEVAADAPAASMPAAIPAAVNLVQTAMNNGSFNTLLAALKTAGLDSVLSGDEPFTIFAPTDEAFAALGDQAVEDLLADKEKLTSVLTYHVIKGKVPAKEVLDLDKAMTVSGSEVAVTSEGGAKIGGANITETDIEASNGIIHVIDKVLIPGM